uniref:Putative secreted protein n=1 Tax=Xenopsylla cheopis TaxID=163159 RepID=A0A6M2DXI8_XENCH
MFRLIVRLAALIAQFILHISLTLGSKLILLKSIFLLTCFWLYNKMISYTIFIECSLQTMFYFLRTPH